MTSFSLSAIAAGYLSELTYRPDAERSICWIPLGGIYWQDELPDFWDFMKLPEEDRKQILRLFAIRFQLWDNTTSSEEDERFWNAATSQVPACPIFRRLELSADDRKSQNDVEQHFEEEFGALFSDADEVTLTDEGHGLQSFSARLDLSQNELIAPSKKPWWERMFQWKDKTN